MHTGPLIGLLDVWTGLLAELNAEHFTHIMNTPHGGRVARLGELRKAQLVDSRRGREGGHKLTLPLSEIPLSRLLTVRSFPDCPTLRFLKHAGDVKLTTIISWRASGGDKFSGTSMGSLLEVLSGLSHIHPLHHTELRYTGICHGYVIRILNLLKHQGLVRVTENKKVMLTRPFGQLTIIDITPLLSEGNWVYDALISRFPSVKLSALC